MKQTKGEKMNATFSKESDSVMTTIGKLSVSGMLIERVGENAYNVISKATGAVLERCIDAVELARYERGMDYIAKQHGREIASFIYEKPVHSV